MSTDDPDYKEPTVVTDEVYCQWCFRLRKPTSGTCENCHRFPRPIGKWLPVKPKDPRNPCVMCLTGSHCQNNYTVRIVRNEWHYIGCSCGNKCTARESYQAATEQWNAENKPEIYARVERMLALDMMMRSVSYQAGNYKQLPEVK